MQNSERRTQNTENHVRKTTSDWYSDVCNAFNAGESITWASGRGWALEIETFLGPKWHSPRVSFETSFDSKQPKLEPKLVSALSETKCLFRFDVSIEPKQTEDQPKQFDREHILQKI